MKTALQQLIENTNDLSNLNDIKKELLKSLAIERQQLEDAFNEGMKYGKSKFQTFDYPTSRYVGFTYDTVNETIKKLEN
jgi:hypothetical protein